MSKRFYKIQIEDIENLGCSKQEEAVLLDAFEYTVKQMATTLARKAWYQLKDYATARLNGIDRFTLKLERTDVLGQEQWYGTFECDSKKLKMIGTSKKN